jgi:hypothetical protein
MTAQGNNPDQSDVPQDRFPDTPADSDVQRLDLAEDEADAGVVGPLPGVGQVGHADAAQDDGRDSEIHSGAPDPSVGPD